MIWMFFTTGGESQIGEWATLCRTFDIVLWPLSKPLEWIYLFLVFRIFPDPHELYGWIVCISFPFGGAVYAFLGWLIGYFLFDRRRSALHSA